MVISILVSPVFAGRELLSPGAWQRRAGGRGGHLHTTCPSPQQQSYVARRAVLYCPGNDRRKLEKLATLDVDCAVLDCEDGVALSKKWAGEVEAAEGRLKP
ncbi:unnamed protein product [Merluccius merluccius]